MATKLYKPNGNDRIGWRLHIPTHAKRATHYECVVKPNGTLIYLPRNT